MLWSGSDQQVGSDDGFHPKDNYGIYVGDSIQADEHEKVVHMINLVFNPKYIGEDTSTESEYVEEELDVKSECYMS